MSKLQSWEVSDEPWKRVEPLVPQRVASAGKQYLRKPGAGRPRKDARLVFEGTVYVLRTGCQWKALPKERFGSTSTIHARFFEWERAGFFEALWQAGLAEPFAQTKRIRVGDRDSLRVIHSQRIR